MDKGDFKRWRKSLSLSQKDAAHKLGLKRRVVQYYEKGERDGNKVEIPLSVRLACWAITEGQEDYHGPAKRQDKAKPAPMGADEGTMPSPEAAPMVDGVPAAAKVGKPAAARRKPAAKPTAKKAKPAAVVEPGKT